jgi:PIN domain
MRQSSEIYGRVFRIFTDTIDPATAIICRFSATSPYELETGSLPSSPSYFVVLDSNVWVAERLLRTSMGSALLHSLIRSDAVIGLPQVVEMEVNPVLEEHAERAVENLRKRIELLRQLSGRMTLHLSVPNAEVISEGMNNRWKALEGLLRGVHFTIQHANAALNRVIKKLPPRGTNNEQFRDCCVWEAVLELAEKAPVHLVTSVLALKYLDRSGSL